MFLKRSYGFLMPALLAAPLFVHVLFAQAPAEAPKRPDFTGRWRMVKEQSNFGKFRMPDIVVRVVEDHDPTMNVHTVQTAGDKTTMVDVSYLTDGTVTKNVINGRDAESKAFWDGDVLVVRTSMKTSAGDNELVTDRWELSEDKNTLVMTSHVDTDKGEADMKMVCIKEKPAGS